MLQYSPAQIHAGRGQAADRRTFKPALEVGSAVSGVHRAQEQHHAARRVEVGCDGDDRQPP